MLAVSLGNQHWRRNDLPRGFSGEGHFLLKYAKGLVLHMCMEFPLCCFSSRLYKSGSRMGDLSAHLTPPLTP